MAKRKVRNERARDRIATWVKTGRCSNCGGDLYRGRGHYVPSSLGEPGFYTCNQRAAARSAA